MERKWMEKDFVSREQSWYKEEGIWFSWARNIGRCKKKGHVGGQGKGEG